MSRRAHQLLMLVLPTARSSDWLAPIASSVLAIVVDSLADRISPSVGLTLAAIALALGVSFALDDPAAASVAASPTPLALRHVVRAACALPLPAAVWLGLVLRSPTADGRAVTLQLTCLVAAALAMAAVASRTGDGGGLIAAPALLALVACAFVLPEHSSFFPSEAPSRAEGFVMRWLLVLGLATCTFVAASLDPARTRIGPKRNSQLSLRCCITSRSSTT